MKKILIFGASVMMMLLAACGSGHYDQKVVDEIYNKGNYTEKDYKTMVDQLGYALDDAEGAKDFGKWAEENEQEAMSIMSLYMTLDNSNFPESLQKDVKSLSKRAKALGDKTMTAPAAGFESDEVVTVDDYSEE